jgi:hypothetical protein
MWVVVCKSFGGVLGKLLVLAEEGFELNHCLHVHLVSLGHTFLVGLQSQRQVLLAFLAVSSLRRPYLLELFLLSSQFDQVFRGVW